MPQDPWNDHNAHLKDFPDQVLFDVARNESAQRDYRRHAVEILVNRKSPRVKHPDLQELVTELEIELDGIQFEYPAPQGPGPLVASVTTETLQQNEDPLWLTSPYGDESDPEETTHPDAKELDARQDSVLLHSETRGDLLESVRVLSGQSEPAASA